MLSRRAFLATAAAALPAVAARPKGVLIDAHIHLFAKDQSRFPFHASAPYRPNTSASPQDLEEYRLFIAESKIDHAVIVHPEPYQDDHSYLEHCFEHEPNPGFFKGTILFDAADSKSPARMRAIVQRFPKRIVAIRVHAMNPPDEAPVASGAIKNRDLRSAEMKTLWRAAGDLGLAVQMHMLPWHATELDPLAREFSSVPIVIDHLARSGMGNAADYEAVLALANHRNVYMKYSGVGYSSREAYPYDDAKPVVRRMYDAFGPERMLWGGLGYTMESLESNAKLLDRMFDFAPESARAQVRGLTAKKLFGF
ncbi:MAG: amidohydrolase family protein [Bryobacterales bacterium]|nr:amidohydrolase family protein [Acidobacteriota bacterium]MCB9385089.1 amidohydrolase family protein [Bryobacterales bacterium]